MKESDDGVKGRYILKFCGVLPKPSQDTVHWLSTVYADDRPHEACRDYDSNNDHGIIHSEINELIAISTHCEMMERECDNQTSPQELVCRIKNLASGNYTIILQHTAPWTLGKMFQENNKNQVAQHFCMIFTHSLPLPAEAPLLGESSTNTYIVLWVCLCGLAVILLIVGIICARRPTRAAVLNKWRERYKNLHMEDSLKKSREACRAVVLLYARDCPPFMDAMRHLRACLRDCCSDKVFDLYDPMTQAEIAPSPTEWIHGLLQKEDVRIVFVETPVAAEIYSATLLDGEEGLSLRTPLLGSRVLYRAPNPADAQLQYAVRLVKHNAHTQLAYLKYYVASVNVTAEVLPNVAPFRRYLLPGGARLLLEHVGGAPLSPHAPVEPLEEALHRYARHVADHPDYVRDLLLLT
ncbi:hypothetical protein EVAR_8434_1 [Eumeta japonica]|uniref:SEFIR domain-containing protein n=1 Tax=Eumeta variegata TaxID=151549 RepID=A0A4C1WBR2_EUMVA|nr:hypothetical protein EVAR_8434_1 [Eumeta japonica]